MGALPPQDGVPLPLEAGALRLNAAGVFGVELAPGLEGAPVGGLVPLALKAGPGGDGDKDALRDGVGEVGPVLGGKVLRMAPTVITLPKGPRRITRSQSMGGAKCILSSPYLATALGSVTIWVLGIPAALCSIALKPFFPSFAISCSPLAPPAQRIPLPSAMRRFENILSFFDTAKRGRAAAAARPLCPFSFLCGK